MLCIGRFGVDASVIGTKDALSWLNLLYLLLHISQVQCLTNMHADMIDSLLAGCRTTARMPT